MKKILWAYIKQFSRKALLSTTVLAVLCAVSTFAQPERGTIRVVLSPRSTADRFEVTKHFGESCRNVLITSNEHDSDYMVVAGGWSGDYRFMVIRKGGAVLYVTETMLLSNSVKNVCKFLNTRAT
jgi:hypothetical protein